MHKAVVIQELRGGSVALARVGGEPILIGRDSDGNHLVCKDKHVSRIHCKVWGLADGRIKIADQSTYGTFVDGKRIEGEGHAGQGQSITLGHEFALTVIGLLDPDATHDRKEPVPPRRLGAHYLLLQEVGRGGMGIVYESWDESRKQRCAIKWLREGGAADDEAMKRFKREAMLQGELGEYPGIVTIFDLGTVTGSGEMFCVMEFVPGDTFLDKLKAKSLARSEGVRLIARVARAVDYAHERGVVHRDIKPANIMITPEGGIRLTDFGIAKALDQGGRITLTGMMMGTPGYMAPEQINDSKSAGPPADIYSLGALLFTFLTGKLPMRGRNLREALENARKGEYGPSPREVDPSIDPVLEAACRRALSHNPEDRWASAAEFAGELERYVKETSNAAPIRLGLPPTAPPPE
jgi:serine/threonine protein kinase